MKIYIAGPIAGRPDGNREAFSKAARWLREQGHEPINPHEVDYGHDGDCVGKSTDRDGDPHRYGCYLLADLHELARCDAIACLTDWHESPGATTEVKFANALGLKQYTGLP